jgi:hypothetical protein
MRETRAAARAQLIRASNLEDLSDANYRQNVSTCLITDCVASISLGIMQIGDCQHETKGYAGAIVGVTGESVPISRTCIPLLLLASQTDRKSRNFWTSAAEEQENFSLSGC